MFSSGGFLHVSFFYFFVVVILGCCAEVYFLFELVEE